MKEYFRVINKNDLKCNCNISTNDYNYHNSLNKYYKYDSYLKEFKRIYKDNLSNKNNSLYSSLSQLDIINTALFAEFILEEIRKEYFNNRLSRLESCFAFKEKNEAIDYLNNKGKNTNLIIIKVIPSDNCIFDESDIFILNNKGPICDTLQDYIDLANDYWSISNQKIKENEIFFQGTFRMKEIN
ncbi:DUF2441 domain-containing protein [Brachyspira pilosicoli]|uniref:DUF2441 domain-containing protein n=1 Tax=Brachyspira pilosicoli TaxID=52584 RepID=UPI00242E3273|nr:DUF2441 domain-containing protein [Brachyspira pilosicoli]